MILSKCGSPFQRNGSDRIEKHNAFFVDLSDRESEALLLILFISAAHEGPGVNMISAWRRGDSETLHRALRESFQDFSLLSPAPDRRAQSELAAENRQLSSRRPNIFCR